MKAKESPQTKILEEGTTLTLTCPVEGDDAGDVRWRKDGGEVPARSEVDGEVTRSEVTRSEVTWSEVGDRVNATLRLVGLTVEDAGVYECHRGRAGDVVEFVVEVRGGLLACFWF